jgi:hypothetical protein
MIARLLRWLFGAPDWTQDDLSAAWRKKMRAHVSGEQATLTIAEDAAWRATHGRRRGAYIWGE